MPSIDTLMIEINASAAKAMPQLDAMAAKLNGLSTALKKASGSAGIKTFQTSMTKSSGALKSFNSSAIRAASGTRTLSTSLVGLYAKVKALEKAFSGLTSGMLSSMNFIETYHYFDVAMTKIGKDNKAAWKEQGYESADAYAKSFSERALKLNEKMSGFTYDENGYATSTGAKSLGLSPGMLMQYQAQFAQMADSIGMSGEAALATSKAMTMLAGDWSSMKNIKFEQSFEKMTSALAGQSRAVRSLGIDITQAALQMQLYDLGIDVTINKLNQAQKSELRMIAILNQSKVAYGDLAKTLNTPANQLRMLNQNAQSLARTIGNIFLPVIQKALPYINGFVIALQRAFQWVAGFMGVNIGDIVSSNSAANGLEALEDLEDDADDLAESLDDADKAAKKLKRTILGFDELNILGDNSDLSSEKDKDKTAGFDSAALDEALFEALADYEKVWNAAFDRMESRALSIADDITAGWKRIYEVIRPTVDAFRLLWNEGLARLKEFTWGTLSDFYHNFLVPVSKWTMGEGLPRFIGALNDLLVSVNFEAIRMSLGGLYDELSRWAVNIGEGLIDFYEDLMGIGGDFLNSLPEWIDKLTEALSGVDAASIRKIGYALGIVAASFTAFKLLTGIEAIILGLSGAIGALAAHPFIALSLGMGALYVALSKYEDINIDFSPIQEEFDKLKKAISDFKEAIAWDDLRMSLIGLFEAIGNFGVNIGAGFIAFLSDLTNAASDFAKDVPKMLDGLTGFFRDMDPQFVQEIGYALGVVSASLAGYAALTIISGIIGEISAAFGFLAAHPFFAMAAGGAAVYAVLKKFNGLNIDFSPVSKEFEDLEKAITSFKESIPWDELKNSLTGLFEAVANFGVNLTSGFIEFLTDVVKVSEGFMQNVPGMFDSLTGFFSGFDPGEARQIGYVIGEIAAALLAYEGLKAVSGIVLGISSAFGALATHPFLAIGLGVGAIAVALDKFGYINIDFSFIADGFDRIRKSIGDFVNNVHWNELVLGLGELIEAFQPFAKGFADGFTEAFDFIINKIGVPAINAVADAIKKVAASFKKIDSKKIEAAGTALGYAAAGLLAFKGLSAALLTVKGLGTALGAFAGHPYMTIALGLGAITLALDKFGLISVDWEGLKNGFEGMKDSLVRLKESVDWGRLADSISGIVLALEPFVVGFAEGFISFMTDLGAAVLDISLVALEGIVSFFEGLDSVLSRIDPDYIKKVGEAFGVLFGVKLTMTTVTAFGTFLSKAATIPAVISGSVLSTLGALATKLGAVGAAAYYAHRALSVDTSTEDMIYDISNPVSLIEEYAASLYELTDVLGLTDDQAEILNAALMDMKRNMIAGNAEPTAQAIAQAFKDANIEASQLNEYLRKTYPHVMNVASGIVPTTKEATSWKKMIERQKGMQESIRNIMSQQSLNLSAYPNIVIDKNMSADEEEAALDQIFERAEKVRGIIQKLNLTSEQASDLTRALSDAGVMSDVQASYDMLSERLEYMGIKTADLTDLFKKEFPEAVYTAKQASIDFLAAKFAPVEINFATNLPEVSATVATSVDRIKISYLDLSNCSIDANKTLYSAMNDLVLSLAIPEESLGTLHATMVDAVVQDGATIQSVYDALMTKMAGMGLETDQLTNVFAQKFPDAVRTTKDTLDPLSTSADEATKKTGGLWDKVTSFSLGAALKAIQMKLIASATKNIGDSSKESSKNVEALQTNLSTMATAIKEKAVEWKKNSKILGDALPEGVAEGTLDGKDKVVRAVEELTNDGIVETVARTLDIHSPSRVMAELAGDAVDGLVLGIDNNINDVASASMDLVSAFVGPFEGIPEKIRSAIGDWYYIGQNASNSLAMGLMSTYIPVPHLGIAGWTQNFLNAERTSWFNTPNYRIDWYAEGGLFTTPTIAGFGEAGAEAALPLTNRRSMTMIADAIVNSGGGGFGLTKKELTDAVEMGVAMGLAQNPQTVEVLVNSVLQTSDETLARAVTRGRAKLDQRYNATPAANI